MGNIDIKKFIFSQNIARLLITLACLIFFFLQSHKEMEKYFSDMSSASTRVVGDMEIRLPRIVICMEEPFKSDKFPMTLDEYQTLTYSQSEVIEWYPCMRACQSESGCPPSCSPGVQVTEIATFWYGRCVMLDIPKNWDSLPVRLNTTAKIAVYFADRGQELCIINGHIHCDKTMEIVIMEELYHEVRIKPKKTVGESRFSFSSFKRNFTGCLAVTVFFDTPFSQTYVEAAGCSFVW